MGGFVARALAAGDPVYLVLLALHVLGGTIAILAGAVALALPQGRDGHRPRQHQRHR